jgi:hypothetical protein
MHYLSYLGHTLQTKNKLELSILRTLENTANRDLIPEPDLKQYKSEILNMVAVRNSLYPRCKPVEVSWWQPNAGKSKDWVLNFTFTAFHLYASNQKVKL